MSKTYVETSSGARYEEKSLTFTTRMNSYPTTAGAPVNFMTLYNGTVGGHLVTGQKFRSSFVDVPDCFDTSGSTVTLTSGSFRSPGPAASVKSTCPTCPAGSVYSFSVSTYYTIEASSNNTSYGTVSKSADEVKAGSSVSLTATAKSGFRFEKWSDGNTTAKRTITNVRDDISLVATFIGWHEFTVKFNANGGSGTMANQSFVHEVPQSLRRNTFKKSGYVFVGWNTKAAGTGTFAADGSDGSVLSSTHGATVTLYAQWRLPNFSSTKRGTEGEDVSAAGRTELVDMDGVILATDNGTKISYECSPGRKYRIRSRDVDKLWSAKGVEVTPGYYESVHDFVYPASQTSFARDYYFAKNRTYRIVPGDGMDGIVSIATQSDSVDESGNPTWLPQTISVNVSVPNGKTLSSYNLLDMETKASVATGGASGSSFKFSFSQEALGRRIGLEVYAGFDDIKYTIRAEVDAESKHAGSVNLNGTDESAIVDAKYGDAVYFNAVPYSQDYEFVGWFDASSQKLVSAKSRYRYDVTDDRRLVAKFGVRVNLHSDTIKYVDNREVHGDYEQSCSITPESVGDGILVTLGDSITYEVMLGRIDEGGSMWNFDGWYYNRDCSADSISDYGPYGTIYPKEPVSLYAKVIARVYVRNIKVYVVDRENRRIVDRDSITEGSIEFSLAASTDGIIRRELMDAPSEKPWKHSVSGTRYITVSSSDSADWGTGDSKAFSYYSYEFNPDVELPECDILSRDANITVLTTKDIVLYAYYGKAERVTTRLAYGVGDRSMGVAKIVSATSDPTSGESAVISEDGLSVETEQNQSFRVEVTVNNGYLFRGLYPKMIPAGEPSYSGSSFDVPVTTERTLYAWFDKDTNAVCEWEGSPVSKMMTWRSKLYVSPRPFNASSIKIDAVNDDVGRVPPMYRPVVQSVSVEMFSAPDSEPTAKAELTNVESQTVRRLPIRRMERYIQVAVENDHEVDAIVVGTSAGGLAI